MKETTDFINDAIGIDPSGCGCTDCIVGNSIPEDQDYQIAELIQAHFEEGRQIINRTSTAMIIYKSERGEYKYTNIPVTGYDPTVLVLPQDGSYYSPEEGIIIRHGYSDPDEDERSVSTDDDDAMQEAIEQHFNQGERLINKTDQTVIIYQSVTGDYGHLMIDAAGDDEPIVSVLPE